MKKTSLQNLVTSGGTPRILLGHVLAVAMMFFPHDVWASLGPVDLGNASGFAVLAGSGITVAGAVNTTTITGDIGTYPTLSITGLGNVVLNGANQTANAGLMLNSQNDLTTAFNAAAGLSATLTYAPIYDLGGQTLTSGVYNDPTSFGLTGVLTLDAQGDPNAVFIIQAGSSLTTASDSSVLLVNGAQACHVFWVVGSSATLGTGTEFVGTIMASASITADTGATVDGRLLAENGAVTLDGNTIARPVSNNVGAVPEPTTFIAGALLLLPFGPTALRLLRQKRGTPSV
jgi:hypothetical protein